jgi:dihydroorotate dehydrogenase (NAD+) catalytic subunit
MARVNLAVEIAGMRLRNPVMLASGTCGYGVEMEDLLDLGAIGGLSVKGLSLAPCEGAPPPRMVETPAGMLNAIGLQNIGVEAFLRDRLPRLRAHEGLAVVANVWGTTLDEYVAVAEALDGAGGVHMLELNVSCPNIKKGGIEFGVDPVLLKELTAAVCSASSLPVAVKLSPNVTRITEPARAALDGGARALSLINTLVGMAVDVERRRPALRYGTGGLSGPAIRPVAVRMVHQTAKAFPGVPLMGMGGIASARDVLEFLMAGASAVQVGTMSFAEPGLAARLPGEIRDWCERHGVADVREIIGCVEIEGTPL